jgi:hypothetical protein
MRVTLTTFHTSEVVTLEISTNIDMAKLYKLCHSLDKVDVKHFGLMVERTEKLYLLETNLWVVVSSKGVAREHGIENDSMLRAIVTADPHTVQELDSFAVTGDSYHD